MKKLFALTLLVCASIYVSAQDKRLKPLDWSVSIDKKEVKIGDIVTLTIRAAIPDKLHVYSNDYECPLGGPNPAVVTLNEGPGYIVIGKPIPVGSVKEVDEIFECTVSLFHHEAVFKQKIKITGPITQITGSLDYQVCSDSGCLTYEYDIKVGDIKVLANNGKTKPASAEPVITIPATEPDTTDSVPADTAKAPVVAPSSHTGNPCDKVNMSIPQKAYEETGNKGSGESLFAFMVLGFIYGLGALLTPCVFPMIPMTVTFFTKQGKGGKFKALMYGIFIILIYTIAGTLVSAFMGPDFANWLSTHWIPNVLFFIIFMVFGASFLGMFEIVLPSRFVNRMDAQSDKGGLLGVFFMAFTMVLVSFSCTGPLASNVLIESFGGNYLKPIAGMFSFALAFAIPFTLFAIFPQWLSSLPKSGGWLNSVKVVLGFIEIGLALKFLSIADTVYHWGILNRDVYLALWIVIAFLVGLYLLGKLRFSHDSPMDHVPVGRLLLAVVFFAFSVWLLPGIFGAPLKELSGYLPPKSTLAFDLSGEKSENGFKAKHAETLHFPHGLSGFFDYCEALEYSKKVGKPIFIDFTGHGCVNCRKMEEYVWAKPEVLKRLKEDFVMLAMYADERKELPENEWYTSPYDGKVKKTVGKQSLDLQVRKFGEISQPFYVTMDENENLLAAPTVFDLEESHFIEFLETAKKNYLRLHPDKKR